MTYSMKSFYSYNLSKEIGFSVYGTKGKPIIVFQNLEDYNLSYKDYMINKDIESLVKAEKILIFMLESVDNESYLNKNSTQHQMNKRNEEYERYILHEFIPYIKSEYGVFGQFMLLGKKIGGYHAINFHLKHPDVFDISLAISPILNLRHLFKEEFNDNLSYFNSPIDYIWNNNDTWFVDKFRKETFIFSTEDDKANKESIEDMRIMQEAFKKKDIDAIFDYWKKGDKWVDDGQKIFYYLSELQDKGMI